MNTDNLSYSVSFWSLIFSFAIWFVGLAFYAMRCALKGRSHYPKVEQRGGTWLLGRWLMEYGYWVFQILSRICIKLRIQPNTLTISSLVSACFAAVAIYHGWFGLGGWLFLGTGILDALDGMVARETGRDNPVGMFLDTVIDRYSEMIFFVAALGYYFPFQPGIAILVGVAMIVSIMITFSRTKAEAQGVTDIPSGLMRRHERLLFIGGGTAISPLLSRWIEPDTVHPVFHAAVGAYGIVAFLGLITTVRLNLQIMRCLKTKNSSTSISSKAISTKDPKMQRGYLISKS